MNDDRITAESAHACLLVDDLEDNLFALELLLRDTGARIVMARSGEEALELLLRQEFAVALIDVQMPGMDGIELAETMRGINRTRGVPIIFVTAAGHDEMRTFRGYESGGAVDFLHKPIQPHVLRSKVLVFLELARRRSEVTAQLRQTKQALAEAEAARNALAEANELRERLLAIVGHDLRTPLTSILMTTHLLARRSAPGADPRYLQGIERSAERMERIIAQLLDFSRTRQAGGFPIDPRECDLVEVCRAVVAEVQAAHPGRSITLEAEGAVGGCFDPHAFSQALANLIVNAVRYGDGSAVRLAIRGGREAIVEVHNGGDPIAPDLLPELFDPYRRGRTSSRCDGLGLGLYITREIVRAHGGTVEVQSERETGTRFRAKLPFVHAPADPVGSGDDRDAGSRPPAAEGAEAEHCVDGR